MSNNYDYNSPWDDNYATNTSNPGNINNQPTGAYNAAPSGGYIPAATSDGFSNPMAQYSSDGPYQASEQQQQQQQQYNLSDSQQAQPVDDDQRRQPESGLKRFLRAHVPLCGPLMDSVCSPLLNIVFKYVNRDLLVNKIFYFFFYSAFGSLFPLMGVYFKQLGMNPAQVGILTGVRPFIEIFSAPFWSSLADRFQKGKALLLFSLASWIIFTYSLAHIRPPASACVAYNDQDFVLYTPYSDNDLRNYDESLFAEKNESSESAAAANELYMGRPPEGREEDKGKILASEENQNDQGKRRRRKKRQVSEFSGGMIRRRARREQINRPRVPSGASRYTYSLVDSDGNEETEVGGHESHFELDIDLENDFDDKLIGNGQSSKERILSTSSNEDRLMSLFEPDSELNYGAATISPAEGDDDDEMEQQQVAMKQSARYKRHAATISPDYNDANENEEEPKAASSSSGRDEESNDYSVEDGDNETGHGTGGGGGGVSGQYYNNKGSRQPTIATKHGQRQQKPSITTIAPTATATTATTTTTMTPKLDEESNPNVEVANGNNVNKTKRIYKQRHKTPPTHIVGMSPITVEYVVNYNKTKHSQFVTPMFSTIVYKLDDIKEVFFLLLLLISLGEFFSAPAINIADSITLGYLGDNTDLYGRQRMFGSFGWAITLMLVGMALDNSTFIADHPCGPHQRERSYTVCFAIFSLLMACAFVTATQFRINYPSRGGGDNGASGRTASGGDVGQAASIASTTDSSNKVITTTVDGQTSAANVDYMYASTQPRNIFNTAPPVNAPLIGQQGKEKFEFLDKWKSAVFAQRRTWDLPEWVNSFKQFKDPLSLTYLFVTWFLGCGAGLVFTFLFWHLQDVGGTPTLFGICSVINHVSEILAYFFSSNFIKRFGHTKGITHAGCFAACCSYMSHVSKPEYKASTQGVMQGLHHGVGRACGALIGGYMINAIGSRASFCIYGLLSGCVLAGFLYVRKKASMIKDEEVKVEDTAALGGYGAPQGVPSAGIPGGKMAQTDPAQDIDYQW